jgi:hypothetical protein
MMPAPAIHRRKNARHSCQLSAGSAQARIGALDSPAVATSIVPSDAQARSFTPTPTPVLRSKTIAATASVHTPHARIRG